MPADERLLLGFIDCEAGMNWGHTCVYVRVGSSRTQIDSGSLPPRLESTGRKLTVVHAGSSVPEWALAGEPAP